MTYKSIGQNVSQTDVAESISVPIVVGTLVSVTILASEGLTEGEPSQRVLIYITARSQGIWVKPQQASIDNDKKGFWVPKDGWIIFDSTAMITGEISAIADLAAADVYVTVL